MSVQVYVGETPPYRRSTLRVKLFVIDRMLLLVLRDIDAMARFAEPKFVRPRLRR